MDFFSRVLPADQVATLAQIQLAQLAGLPPVALTSTKRLMKTSWNADLNMRMKVEIAQFVNLLTQPPA